MNLIRPIYGQNNNIRSMCCLEKIYGVCLMKNIENKWDYPKPYVKELSPSTLDIDGLNHTNNAVYVRWCEYIAWEHSGSLGMDLDAYKKSNRAMAIRKANYDYVLSSNLGDKLLIGTWLTSINKKLSMERRFQIIRLSDSETILRAKWNLVCIEIDSGRPRRMPQEFLNAYSEALVGFEYHH